MKLCHLVLIMLLSAAPAFANDEADESKTDDAVTTSGHRLELDTTSVSGSRELPKVLVIVPWKDPALAELTGRPLASLVEEALSPLDPDVFRREVKYFNELNDAGDEEDDAPASDQ